MSCVTQAKTSTTRTRPKTSLLMVMIIVQLLFTFVQFDLIVLAASTINKSSPLPSSSLPSSSPSPSSETSTTTSPTSLPSSTTSLPSSSPSTIASSSSPSISSTTTTITSTTPPPVSTASLTTSSSTTSTTTTTTTTTTPPPSSSSSSSSSSPPPLPLSLPLAAPLSSQSSELSSASSSDSSSSSSYSSSSVSSPSSSSTFSVRCPLPDLIKPCDCIEIEKGVDSEFNEGASAGLSSSTNETSDDITNDDEISSNSEPHPDIIETVVFCKHIYSRKQLTESMRAFKGHRINYLVLDSCSIPPFPSNIFDSINILWMEVLNSTMQFRETFFECGASCL